MQENNFNTELAALEQEEKAYWTKLRAQKALVSQYLLGENDENPAVFIGTYGKYNGEAGAWGAWIDLTMCDDYDEFIEVCRLLHEDEADPELAAWDYMYFPEELYSESIMDRKTFDIIKEYSEADDKEAMDAFITLYGIESMDKFEEMFMGKWDSEEDFAEHIINECYDLDKMMGRLSYYFDYKSFARDLFLDGYDFENGYVFYNR